MKCRFTLPLSLRQSVARKSYPNSIEYAAWFTKNSFSSRSASTTVLLQSHSYGSRQTDRYL